MEPLKCWCEYPEDDRLPKLKQAWVIPRIGMPGKWTIKFCPCCGRELNKPREEA